MAKTVTIHVCALSNPRSSASAWAVRLSVDGHVREMVELAENTSSNCAVILAATRALDALKRPCNVEVISDATYLTEGMSLYIERWSAADFKQKDGSARANADAWRALERAARRHDIRWTWERQRNREVSQQQHSTLKQLLSTSCDKAPTTQPDFLAEGVSGVTSAKPAEAPAASGMAVVYSDGSCLGNPGAGGWAAHVLSNGKAVDVAGAEDNTTNNRMELMAAIQGILASNSTHVRLVTDSKYVIKGAMEWMEGWKRNGWRTSNKAPVKNADLWKMLDEAMQGRSIVMDWVKGHSGNEYNERVDTLARDQARKLAISA